jgi:hypothetical protein
VSRRAELRRQHREASRAHAVERVCNDRIPAVPGVIPDHTPESIAAALEDAHAALPEISGTRVEVTTYERGVGLQMVEWAWGLQAAVGIAAHLDRSGPGALVVIAMRVPHAWHRTANGEFCCDDIACPNLTAEATS